MSHITVTTGEANPRGDLAMIGDDYVRGRNLDRRCFL